MDVCNILKKDGIKILLKMFEGNIEGIFKGESVKLQLTIEKENNDVFYKLRDQFSYKGYPENYITS